MRKLFAILVAALLAVTAVPALAFAADPAEASSFVISDVDYDDPVSPGNTVEVTVTLANMDLTQDIESVEVKVWLMDYFGARVTNKVMISGFQIQQDSDTDKVLKIALPSDLEEGEYTLRVEASGRWEKSGQKETIIADNLIEAEQLDDSLFVSELRFTKESYKSSDTVDAAVTVMNNGKEDLESVQVTIAVPELDIVKSLTLFGTLFSGAEQTVYLTFQLPEDASGIFTMKATAANGLATSTASKVLVVADAQETIDTSKVSNAQLSKELVVGKDEIISMQVANKGTVTKSYSVSTDSDNGLEVMVEPQSFSLAPGQSRNVLVHLTATETGTSNAEVTVVEGNTAVSAVSIDTTATQGFTQNTGLFMLAVLIIAGIVLYMQYRNPEAEKKTLYY